MGKREEGGCVIGTGIMQTLLQVFNDIYLALCDGGGVMVGVCDGEGVWW